MGSKAQELDEQGFGQNGFKVVEEPPVQCPKLVQWSRAVDDTRNLGTATTTLGDKGLSEQKQLEQEEQRL